MPLLHLQNPMRKYDFDKDLGLCLEKHKGLTISTLDNGLKIISGFIRVINPENNKSPVTYNIKMEIPDNFPYAFPIVFEVGGKFPINDHSKYHINPDKTLCLDIKASEIIKTKNGISLNKFISQELIPNLSWRYCVLHEYPFIKEEWNHGEQGLIDFYKARLRETNIFFMLKMMEVYVNPKSYNRNSICFCSNKKALQYKNCHEKKQGALNLIGKKQVLQDFLSIKAFVKKVHDH